MLAKVIKDKAQNWLEVGVTRQHGLRIIRALHCLELEEMRLFLAGRTGLWLSAFLVLWRQILFNRVCIGFHRYGFFLNLFCSGWRLFCQFGWLGIF